MATDLSAPKVNDVYDLHIVSGIAGLSSCAGGADLHTEVILPDHTTFAVGGLNQVTCYFYPSSGGTLNVTNDPSADCPKNR